MKKNNHGGKRKNATGRPRLMPNRVKVSLSLDKTHVDTLDRLASQQGVKRSEALRTILAAIQDSAKGDQNEAL